MELGPVLFTNPWGFLALLSIPAILGIHFFRKAFQRREVSGLFLWETVSRSRSGGSRIDRPPFSWNLLLQLLIAALLSLLIAGPQLRSSHQHHILLIDRSASMHAEQSGGRTSFERAVTAAQEELESLSSGARVSLLATGPPVARVGSDVMGPSRAQQVLDRMKSGYQSFDLEQAIQQAYHMAGSASVMYFYTDRKPSGHDGPLPERLNWHAVGASMGNLAWTSAHRTPTDGDGSRVLVQLKNYSTSTQSVKVRFRRGEQVLVTKTPSVAAGESWQATVELDLDREPLDLVMTPATDALPLDDRLVLFPPMKKTVRAGMTGLSSSNRSLVARGLSSVDDVRMLKNASRKTLTRKAHLIVGPVRPSVRSSFKGVFLGLHNLDRDAVQERSFVRGPYFVDEDHPLMKNLVLDGLVFGGVNVGETPAFDTSPLSAGNTPLLYTRSGTPEHRYYANFDPSYSTIKSSAAWPMLMTNLAGVARERLPGPLRSNFRIDEPVVLSTRASAGQERSSDTDWSLTYPSGRTRSLDPGRMMQLHPFSGPPGRYSLHRRRDRGDRTWPFRVNFLHPEESDLLDLGEGTKKARDTSVDEQSRWSDHRPLQLGLILLLAVLSSGSWLLADRGGARGTS